MKLRGKRKTMSQLAKEIRENNETITFSAKYIRNLNGYAKYRELTTVEIVRRLTVWYGLNFIFMDGNRVIATCSNGFPIEPIYQRFRVILMPLKNEPTYKPTKNGGVTAAQQQ